MDNNLYNLMLQLTQEQKSIWRVRKYYIGDAGSCEECRNFWTKFLQQKEDNVNEIRGLIKKHIG
ncbi:MAG: hypothetical protein COU82_01240 [Candidatus Portnoybacteria bacterium CG10_big_fil_rev_8_21_14_0_10_38_18]|uniref:Uncharacterized protein n=1 Tax=Candidatus Portnoybacteria bacterium CG10_big_fil_rev_8_21_14_0_10_38_18 TaxID=1974813 RepID=A0A2M8KCA9_9BACT|nr:MAG: hypothetical protein COU82_01240 [Candidatus Portnoybacteria bacterium CG10_big_fil_rev_8_21_14_0_10_38_18]